MAERLAWRGEEGGVKYNLRGGDGAKKPGKVGNGKDKESETEATPGGKRRGRKKKTSSGREGSAMDGSVTPTGSKQKEGSRDGSRPAVRTLEEFWGTDGGKGSGITHEMTDTSDETEKGKGEDKRTEEVNFMINKRSIERKENEQKENENKEKDGVNEIEKEAFKVAKCLQKTPVGQKDGNKQKEMILDDTLITLMTSENSSTQEPTGGNGKLDQTQEKGEGGKGIDTLDTKRMEGETVGDQGSINRSSSQLSVADLDRLEKWMVNCEERQKEEWEARMADMENLIRAEVRKGVCKEKCEDCRKNREERGRIDNWREELFSETQERLRQTEAKMEELVEKVREWKGVADLWKQKAEKLEQVDTGRRECPKEIEVGDKQVPAHQEPHGRSLQGDGMTLAHDALAAGGLGVPGTWKGENGFGFRPAEEGNDGVANGGKNGENGRTSQGVDLRSVGEESGGREEGWKDGDQDGRDNEERIAGDRDDEIRGRKEAEKYDNPPPRALEEEEWKTALEARRLRRKNFIIEGLTLLTRTRKEELEGWCLEELGVRIRTESWIGGKRVDGSAEWRSWNTRRR